MRAAAFDVAARGPLDGLLPALPALSERPPVKALRNALLAFVGLTVAFMAFTGFVAAGQMQVRDRQVASAMASAWDERLHPIFQALAVLGGLEVTSVLAIGLVAYLWRKRF